MKLTTEKRREVAHAIEATIVLLEEMRHWQPIDAQDQVCLTAALQSLDRLVSTLQREVQP